MYEHSSLDERVHVDVRGDKPMVRRRERSPRATVADKYDQQVCMNVGPPQYTYSLAWSAWRHLVAFSRTFSHLTCPRPGTVSCALDRSSLQYSAKAMLSNLREYTFSSSSVSGFRGTSGFVPVEKNSSSPIVSSACVYKSARSSKGGQCGACSTSADI